MNSFICVDDMRYVMEIKDCRRKRMVTGEVGCEKVINYI
jgi:hypothetical protein